MGSYVVYTYGGGEALYEVFNAIAAMTGGSDYLTLIKLFCVLALFWVVIEMGVHKTVNWQWFLMFMVMFNIFFVPKKAVTIIDRFNPTATRVVANVPFGLAAPAWLFSTMGDGITGLMETYFTLPNDMKYEKTGMIFGSKLMTSINRARFDDPLLNKNLDTYAKQCIYYNIAYGFYSFSDIYKSTNLQSLLFSSTNNSNIRGMFYSNGTGQSFLTCSAAATQLKTDMTPVVDSMLGKYANMLFANQQGSALQKKARLISALPAGYAFFSGISVTAQQQLMQSALSNYILNSYGSVAASANAGAAATSYATAVAERQQRSAWRTMGELSSRSLPIMRTVFEVIIYSLFFLVFLALLLPMSASGKALSTWFKMIIWIQVWPPLFAILNLVVSLYGKTATGALISITTMDGMMGMSEVHSDMAMVGGYLAMSIPVLAWSLVSMSGQVMGTLAGGLMQPGSQAAGQASGETARGNISTGNTSMSNKSMMQDMTGPNMNLGGSFDTGAMKQTISSQGRITNQGNFASMGVDVQAQQGIQHATSTALTHAKAQEQSHASSYATAQGNESAAQHQFVQQATHSDNKGLKEQVSDIVGNSGQYQSSYDVGHGFAQKNNIADSTSTAMTVTAGANAQGNATIDTKDSLLGEIAEAVTGGSLSASVGAKATAEIKGMSDSKFNQVWEQATSSNLGENYNQAVKRDHALADIASHDTADSTSGSAAQSLTDAHKQTETEQQQWSDASKQVDQLQKAEQYTSSEGFSTNTNMNQYLEDYMRDHGMAADVDDQGLRTETANSEGFAEYALNRSGIQTDLNNDGKTEGWNKYMDEQAKHTGEHTPNVAAQHGTTAENAGKDQGLTSNEMPQTASSQKVDQKIDAGEAQAGNDKAALQKGGDHVKEAYQHTQGEVNSQSIDTTQREIRNIGQAAWDAVADPIQETVEKMHDAGLGSFDIGFDVNKQNPNGDHVDVHGDLDAKSRTMGDKEGQDAILNLGTKWSLDDRYNVQRPQSIPEDKKPKDVD